MSSVSIASGTWWAPFPSLTVGERDHLSKCTQPIVQLATQHILGANAGVSATLGSRLAPSSLSQSRTHTPLPPPPPHWCRGFWCSRSAASRWLLTTCSMLESASRCWVHVAVKLDLNLSFAKTDSIAEVFWNITKKQRENLLVQTERTDVRFWLIASKIVDLTGCETKLHHYRLLKHLQICTPTPSWEP